MGLLVCFACLALSARSASSVEENSTEANAKSCQVKELFDRFNTDGSVTLQDLDRILRTVKEACSSYWAAKEIEKPNNSVPTLRPLVTQHVHAAATHNNTTESDESQVPYSLSSKGKDQLVVFSCG